VQKEFSFYKIANCSATSSGRAIGNIIFVVVINLLLGLTPGIDDWGHVGGLVGGLIFTWFAGPLWEVEGLPPDLRLADKREPREVLTGAAIVILIFGVVAVHRDDTSARAIRVRPQRSPRPTPLIN